MVPSQGTISLLKYLSQNRFAASGEPERERRDGKEIRIIGWSRRICRNAYRTSLLRQAKILDQLPIACTCIISQRQFETAPADGIHMKQIVNCANNLVLNQVLAHLIVDVIGLAGELLIHLIFTPLCGVDCGNHVLVPIVISGGGSMVNAIVCGYDIVYQLLVFTLGQPLEQTLQHSVSKRSVQRPQLFHGFQCCPERTAGFVESNRLRERVAGVSVRKIVPSRQLRPSTLFPFHGIVIQICDYASYLFGCGFGCEPERPGEQRPAEMMLRIVASREPCGIIMNKPSQFIQLISDDKDMNMVNHLA